jgi:hypothetical protein
MGEIIFRMVVTVHSIGTTENRVGKPTAADCFASFARHSIRTNSRQGFH